MLAKAPDPDPAHRHAYVEGVHTRTAKDGRVYRLCRVCDDRANASPHRGFRTTPPTPRERAPRHAFDPSLSTVIRDSRGHATPACVFCGKAQRATEHGGITDPLRRPGPLIADEGPRLARGHLRSVGSTDPDGGTPVPARRTIRPAQSKIVPPPAETAMVALAIDRLLALPADLVDWRLRTRLESARDLIPVPVFPTLDVRLTPEVEDETETETPERASQPRPRPIPLPTAQPAIVRGILAGIRNDRARELVKRAVASGFSASKTGSGHVALDKGSTRLIVSTTSNDGRMGHGWGNLRATAKRAGIDVTGL